MLLAPSIKNKFFNFGVIGYRFWPHQLSSLSLIAFTIQLTFFLNQQFNSLFSLWWSWALHSITHHSVIWILWIQWRRQWSQREKSKDKLTRRELEWLKESKPNQSTLILFNEWVKLIWFVLFAFPAAAPPANSKIFWLAGAEQGRAGGNSISFSMKLWGAAPIRFLQFN